MPEPFEVNVDSLRANIDDFVITTFKHLQSQVLVLPKGPNFIEYGDFEAAYQVLRLETSNFQEFSEEKIWNALRKEALTFVVLRTILGVSPPEWADLARGDLKVDVPQGTVRDLDTRSRQAHSYFARLDQREGLGFKRVQALVKVAVTYISRGAPVGAADTVHRLAKVDTSEGLVSVRHAVSQHVPYAVLLYERYLGRPFASHRDSVSELIGDVMEAAIEERLTRAKVPYRKTKRAERVPRFEQAPDFFIPDEFNPAVVIEAKIAGDDGTARDKVTRIEKLAAIRDDRIRAGEAGFQVVACIDGRGFGVRREDMKRMLLRTEGKVFTL